MGEKITKQAALMNATQTTKPATTGAKKRMPSNNLEWWSTGADILAVSGLVLGAIVTAVAIAGWTFSWKAGRLKDSALANFQAESAARISEAETKVAEANRAASEANERAALLEKEAAVAKLELEKIKSKQEPRRITREQKAKIVELLKAIEHKPKVFIAASLLDAEAMTFGEDTENVLQAAGFETEFPKDFSANASMMIGPPGFHLLIKDKNNSPKSAGLIQQSFLNAGVELRGIQASEPDFEIDRIEIRIGQK